MKKNFLRNHQLTFCNKYVYFQIHAYMRQNMKAIKGVSINVQFSPIKPLAAFSQPGLGTWLYGFHTESDLNDQLLSIH